jgi:hypothetical protein
MTRILSEPRQFSSNVEGCIEAQILDLQILQFLGGQALEVMADERLSSFDVRS